MSNQSFCMRSDTVQILHMQEDKRRKWWKPSNPSVNRFSDIFHHPVELLWLISINVVRGVVYRLHRGQTGNEPEWNSRYTTKSELKGVSVELGETHQYSGGGLLPDLGHPLPRRAVHPGPRSVQHGDRRGRGQQVNPLQHGPLGPAQRLRHGAETHLATGRGSYKLIYFPSRFAPISPN